MTILPLTAPAKDRTIFERVREEVDIRHLLPPDPDAHSFDRYELRHCIFPGHRDGTMSMLCYPDQVRCQACGAKADAVDLWAMSHPGLNKYQCAEQLLADPDLQLDRSQITGRPNPRELDPDLATRYHLALALNPEAFDRLKSFGFEVETIRAYRLGWARILARLLPSELELAKDAPDIEERDGKLYQWQWRFSVPVYVGGKLKQVLYRKSWNYTLGAKIQMEKGAGTQYLFNQDALRGAELSVLCEGWGDALAFHQAGITAVSGISGAGQFLDEWVPLLSGVKRLYVVGDADSAGEKMMARVKGKIPWARPLHLPGELGSKQDIRELWLSGWRRPEFLNLLKQADIQNNWKAVRRK